MDSNNLTKAMSHGTWPSPISSTIVSGYRLSYGLPISELTVDDNGDLYWLESRSLEEGRNTIMRWTSTTGKISEALPIPYNARAMIYENGGGSFTVHHKTLYFTNFVDQKIYRIKVSEDGLEPQAGIPITAEGSFRYAEQVVDTRRGRLICLQEERSHPKSPNHTLVSLDIEGKGKPVSLVGGNDFYSSIRLSKDSSKLAWLTWNHPKMPFFSTNLEIGKLDSSGRQVREIEHVAGGESESIFQPEWGPDGSLYFASDKSGWWSIYRWAGGEIEPVAQEDQAEFGRAQFQLGHSHYAVMSNGEVACSLCHRGYWGVVLAQVHPRNLKHLTANFSAIDYLRGYSGDIFFCGGRDTEPTSILRYMTEEGKCEVLYRSTSPQILPRYLSRPIFLEFPTQENRPCYSFYYAPHNSDYPRAKGEKPPLLVNAHGGPTSTAPCTFNLAVQFWTSRGFAYLDVNYGGSSGFGRKYMERLNGQWGIVDVQDCANGARDLIKKGLVDPNRVAIRGGSAGGYTTLMAAASTNVFKAAAAYYAVSDLLQLESTTHKLEAHYSDTLIGPYSENSQLYRARSAINHIGKVNCPLILFHGALDKVVPPAQAETVFNALRERGLPVAYLLFENEDHGFRHFENIKRSLEAEYYFYSRIFKFGLDERGPIPPPVTIENL